MINNFYAYNEIYLVIIACRLVKIHIQHFCVVNIANIVNIFLVWSMWICCTILFLFVVSIILTHNRTAVNRLDFGCVGGMR